MDDDAFVDGGDWLNTRQACDLLGIAQLELFRMIDAGRLPAFRFNGEVRLRRSDVEILLTQQ